MPKWIPDVPAPTLDVLDETHILPELVFKIYKLFCWWRVKSVDNSRSAQRTRELEFEDERMAGSFTSILTLNLMGSCRVSGKGLTHHI